MTQKKITEESDWENYVMKKVLGFILSCVLHLSIVLPLCYLWEVCPDKDLQIWLFPSLTIASIIVIETIGKWVKKVLEIK